MKLRQYSQYDSATANVALAVRYAVGVYIRLHRLFAERSDLHRRKGLSARDPYTHRFGLEGIQARAGPGRRRLRAGLAHVVIKAAGSADFARSRGFEEK